MKYLFSLFLLALSSAAIAAPPSSFSAAKREAVKYTPITQPASTVVVTSNGKVRKAYPSLLHAATKFVNKKNAHRASDRNMLSLLGNSATSVNVGKMVGAKLHKTRQRLQINGSRSPQPDSSNW